LQSPRITSLVQCDIVGLGGVSGEFKLVEKICTAPVGGTLDTVYMYTQAWHERIAHSNKS